MTHPRTVDASLHAAIATTDPVSTALSYWRHDELAVLPELVPPDIVAAMAAETVALRSRVVRRRLFSYKRSGSLSYFALRDHAPTAVALYRSPSLLGFLSELASMSLVTCPEDDPHACAVYWYDRPGDRIGFHYDTSWYRGARYTVLVGLVDQSSARLWCQVHARNRHRPTLDLEVQTSPGTMVLFNGDKLRHAVTRLGTNEQRIVLSLQYVSDPRIGVHGRVVSRLKDSLGYFGAEAFRARRDRRLLAPPQGLA